jgi:hypothetical protein
LIGLAARLVHQERLNRDLLTAVEANDPTRVADLLKRGADADATVGEHVGFLEFLRSLLPGAPPRPEKHVLDVAAGHVPTLMIAGKVWFVGLSPADPWFRDNATIVEMLLTHGAVARGYRKVGNLPSPVVATVFYHPLTLHVLLKHGVRADAASLGPEYGHDLLRMAIASYKMPTQDIVALIKAGAAVNDTSQDGDAAGPLRSALSCWRWDVVHALLQMGADPTLGSPSPLQDLELGVKNYSVGPHASLEKRAEAQAFLPGALPILQEMRRYAAIIATRHGVSASAGRVHNN